MGGKERESERERGEEGGKVKNSGKEYVCVCLCVGGLANLLVRSSD